MRWFWLLALAACGDNVTPRLEQVRYDVASVEVADPQLFHDRVRGEDCVATPWADGATYCTPAFTPAVYTDPLCSEPLAQGTDVPTGYASTYFVLRGEVSLRRLRPITGEVAPPAQYWVLEGPECAGPYTGDATTHFAAVGAELDESQFARLRRSALLGDGPVQRFALDTDDGLHAIAGFHDRELAADCSLEHPGDVATPRCVPAAIAATLFDDASCSQPVLVAPAQPPAFAHYGDADCPTYAPLADDVTGQPVFHITNNQCTPVTLPDGNHLISVGPPLDVPVVTRERGAGTRIQPITVVTGDVRAADTRVHDTELGVDCQPGQLAGSSRCLPATTGILSYFIDDQCRDSIDVAFLAGGSCAPQPRFALGQDAIHAIGDAVPTQLYEISTGDRCVPYAPPTPLVAHLVGPALPLETFVAADVRY